MSRQASIYSIYIYTCICCICWLVYCFCIAYRCILIFSYLIKGSPPAQRRTYLMKENRTVVPLINNNYSKGSRQRPGVFSHFLLVYCPPTHLFILLICKRFLSRYHRYYKSEHVGFFFINCKGMKVKSKRIKEKKAETDFDFD